MERKIPYQKTPRLKNKQHKNQPTGIEKENLAYICIHQLPKKVEKKKEKKNFVPAYLRSLSQTNKQTKIPSSIPFLLSTLCETRNPNLQKHLSHLVSFHSRLVSSHLISSHLISSRLVSFSSHLVSFSSHLISFSFHLVSTDVQGYKSKKYMYIYIVSTQFVF